jgi:serine/threonine protein kinase
VLKTYQSSESAQAYFENEVKAFKKLSLLDDYNNSIIKFYGNYTQGNTYNILLEYADKGDLEDYFQRELPLTLLEEIGKFWKGKFSIVDALKTIHNIGDEGPPQQSRCFQG